MLRNFTAFVSAILTSVSTGLAHGNVRELVAFFFAIEAYLFNGLREGRHMVRVDRGQSGKGIAGRNKLERRIGASRHARILHPKHAEAMPEAIIAGFDTFDAGFFEGAIFRRMHMCVLHRPHLLGLRLCLILGLFLALRTPNLLDGAKVRIIRLRQSHRFHSSARVSGKGR